jgi:methionyl-tRNA formyltransferase
MNVVLVAEESAGLQMLRALAGSGHRLAAVLAQPPSPSTTTSVWNAARNLGFETWPASRIKDADLAAQLRSEKVDVLLNVHSLYIIHNEVLKAPRLGAFNLHPGPLPRYAGLNAVSWAIFRGEQIHAVTVHGIEAGIDTGPIVYQTRFPIEPEETALTLSFKCAREGVALMLRLLQVAASDPANIPRLPQDLGTREYFGNEVPEQGRVSWRWPASRIVNFVRACDYFPFRSPWGHPRTLLGTQEFALVKARRTGLPADAPSGTVGKSADSGVLVACQDEWVLVRKLLVEGKHLPAQEILRSGARLAEYER